MPFTINCEQSSGMIVVPYQYQLVAHRGGFGGYLDATEISTLPTRAQRKPRRA